MDRSNIDLDEFSKIVGPLIMGHAFRLFSSTYAGDLNRMKNRALSADVDGDGAICDPEQEVTADNAKDVLDMCRYALEFFQKHVFAAVHHPR